MEYETREVMAGDTDEVVDLIGQVMEYDPADPERSFHLWKHEANAFGRSFGRVAVDEAGSIIAVRLFMRWRFRLPGGEVIEAARAVDTVTHPSALRRGLFSRLTMEGLDDLRTAGVSCVFNTPNDQSRPGYLKLGWSELGRAPLAVRVRPGARLGRAGRWKGSDKWGVETDAGVAPNVAFVDRAEVDAVLRRSEARIETDVSAEFLAWRYGFEPLHYRVVCAGGELAAGAVVVRLRRRGDRLDLTVCDELGSRRGVAAAISSAMRSTGADMATRLQPQRFRRGFARLSGRGPIVTWRPVADDRIPPFAALSFRYGDLELF